MKSHMLLYRVLLNEMGSRCCASTDRDFKTITERVKDEGFSFLTITLTNFAKDFEKSLDQGFVDSSSFLSFRKDGYLPKLFRGFTSLIFDARSGCLVDDPCHESIYAVRQLTLFFGKVGLPCSDARITAAFDRFIDCEEEIRLNDSILEYDDLRQLQRIGSLIFGSVMSVCDRLIYDGEIVPKHGPGSTADKLLGNDKYNQTEWTERLEEIFPHGEFLFPSWSHFLDSPGINLLEPGSERPVRVITVPKTLKTPRIIAIEPTCMQYTQQGISEALVSALQSPSLSYDGDNIARHFVGFDDQVPNQELAREGSIAGSLATLDLSEASDRVSNQHVRALFGPFSWLARGLDCTRSRKADVPGYGVIRLAKFASMGSALCFPVEAMVFATLVFCGIEDELRRPLSRRDLLDFVGKVRVYGDDIIVPVDFVHAVTSKLSTFGYKVNTSKSFWTGRFRESCGREYYAGTDVSIVRFRRMLPSKRQDVQELVSAVSLRNQMYYAGNWETAAFLDRLIERLIPFPVVLPTSPVLGRHSHLGYSSEKLCPRLHTDLVRGYVVKSRLPLSHLSGSGALLKWFLKRGDLPFADRNHLERSGRPSAVDIKLRWAQPY